MVEKLAILQVKGGDGLEGAAMVTGADTVVVIGAESAAACV